MRTALWWGFALLALAAPVAAQEVPKPPSGLAGLAKALGRKAAAPADATLFRFKPSGNTPYYDQVAAFLGETPEQKKALRQVLVDGARLVETLLAAEGYPNDLSAGLATGLAAAWETATGKSVPDPASAALVAQLRAGLDGPELRAASDAEKQAIYEYGVGTAVLLHTLEETAKDAESKKGLKILAEEVIRSLAGASSADLVLDEKGIRRRDGAPAPEPAPAPVPAKPTAAPAASKDGFHYDSTTFSDGWTAHVRPDWVEAVKGDLVVRIHYPHPQADAYHSVLAEGLQRAWNLLVASRYRDVRNFALRPIQSFESIAFAEADAVEKSSGKRVHVVLFKKHVSTGNGRYLEFVSPSKAAFEKAFGPYRSDEFGWEPLSNMQNANRFAVAPRDLAGTWNTSGYASLVYYYVDSGRTAGATATSTSDSFTFTGAGAYRSDHTGASGLVGKQKFSRQQYKGTVTVDSWNLTLTNRFQGESETFQCHFEAVRGGRILILTDRRNTVLPLVRQ